MAVKPTPAEIAIIRQREKLWRQNRPKVIAQELGLPLKIVQRVICGIKYCSKERP